MSETAALIGRAVSADSSASERRAAFGEIVARFQDMAFGCALALTGDRFLAEDAAQQAFVTAWRKLDALESPAAFPAWLRRIVFTECNRLQRSRRVLTVPLDSAPEPSANGPDPAESAERAEVVSAVRAAIASLPEHERIATFLYYIGDFSQVEIGDFLEIPAGTVAKRLFSARRRLREGELSMFGEEFRENRPSRDDRFAEEVKERLRPFAPGDWGPVAAVVDAFEPVVRADDAIWLRNRQAFDEEHYARRHYLVEDARTNSAVGYGAIEQSLERVPFRVHLVLDPARARNGAGAQLLERLLADARELGARIVWAREFAENAHVLELLRAHDFAETRRVFDLRLDPAIPLDDDLRAAEARVAAEGIEITTFAEERERDPRALEKLHAFLNEAKADDPARQPFRPSPLEDAARWMARSDVLPEANFIARHGERYVGFTDLALLEPLPGGIMAGFTGVARDWRRRGVGTALKVRATTFARAREYTSIRTFNHVQQTAMLGLNERVGFERVHGYVTMERGPAVQPAAVEVPREALRRLAGEYQHESGFVVILREDGQTLIGSVRGLEVRLLPLSQTRFFVKPMFETVEFLMDAEGGVRGLEVQGEKQREVLWRR